MKNFDEKIRDKLFDAEMPVSDGIWDAIEHNLDRKDNRPVRWFFLLTLLMGLPALFFSYEFGKTKTDSLYDTVASVDHSNISGSSVNADRASNSLVSYFDTQDENQEYARISLAPPRSIYNRSFRNLTPQATNKLNLSFQIVSGSKARNLNSFDELASIEELSTLQQNSIKPNSEGLDNYDVERLFANKTECPSFKPGWPGWYLHGNLSTYYPFEQLSTSNAELNSLLEQRIQTESGLPSFGITAGAGYDFTNGMFIEAGISYNQTNIKFLHRELDVINNTTSIVIDTIFNSNGEVIAINKDTSVVQEVGVHEVRWTNKFRMLDIPVSVGFGYPISENFNLRASVGLALNLRNTSSGYVVDNEGEPYEFNNEMNPMFKTRLSMSFLASVGLESKIHDRLFFTAGLNLRSVGSNINLESNPIDQSFVNLGLNAGIRYRI